MIKIQLVDMRSIGSVIEKLKADMAAADGVIGIDCETHDRNNHDGLKAFNNKTRHVFDHRRTVMTGFSLYPKGGDTAYYINLNQADEENRLPPEIVAEVLAMKPEGVTWVAHNAPYELVMFLQCYGVEFEPGSVVCTLQMAVSDHGPDEYDLQTFYAAQLPIRPILGDIIESFSTYDKEKQGKNLNPDQQFVLGQFIGKETDAAFSYNGFVKDIAFGFGLKKLVKSLFGYQMTTYEDVLKANGAEDMGDLTGEQVCEYGADDAFWAVQVYDALVAKMMRENPAVLVTFLEQENPMIHVYADVWLEGLRINQDEVFARREEERKNYADVLRQFKRALGELLPFDEEPNAELLKWQPWYEKWEFLRARLIDWINTPDSADDFEQCFQVSNPIGNAWATEKGIKVPKSGKLNLTHYYQMRLILHDLLGHKLVRISGDITTDKDARARMALTYAGNDYRKTDVLALITKLSNIEQVMKLYLTPYTQLMDPETNCLYSVISSMLASRRLGARFPNPMQLAKRGESTYVRGFYLADDDDHLIVSADWSSVELVEIGDFSGDPEFAQVFGQLPYGDLHSGATVDCLRVDPRYDWLTEDEFLTELKRGRNPMNRDLLDFNGKPMEPAKWVKFMRTEVGKGANFNYFYSGALSTIAEKLGWDSATHWAAVDRYRDRFWKAEEWRLSVIDEVCRTGMVTLPDGHRRVRFEATEAWYVAMRRKFADVLADPAVLAFADLALPKIQTRAKNQAVNSMIQGSCATLAKRSIQSIRRTVNEQGVKFVEQFADAEKRTAMEMVRLRRRNQGLARFMLPIHDELLFSVHRDYVPEFIPILREGMCTHPDIIRTLPLSCNVAVGRTFKPYDGTGFSQLELDEAPAVEGLIGEEWEGKMLPPEFYPKVVDWLMAA